MFLPNLPEFPIIYFGVLKAGGVVTAANPLFTTEELAKQLKLADAKWILTVPQLVHRAKEAMQDLGRENVFVIGDVDGCESLSVLLQDDGSSVPDVTVNPKEDIAVLPFSSGTTGHPKGVMLTHYNLVSCGSIMRTEGFLSFSDTTVLLAFLPFFHVYGMVAIMSMGLHCGSTIITMSRFERDKFLHALENYEVSYKVTPQKFRFVSCHRSKSSSFLVFLIFLSLFLMWIWSITCNLETFYRAFLHFPGDPSSRGTPCGFLVS